MNILYVSSLCSKKEFKKIYDNAKNNIAQQSQKYHILMAEGFSLNANTKVTVLSARPISRSVSDRVFWKHKNEIENKILFSYIPFINIPILRHIMIFIYSFISTLVWGIKNKDGAVICDVLNISVNYGALLAAKILNRHIAGIVTDVPGFFSEDEGYVNKIKIVLRKINMVFISSLDSYVFLTEFMNNIINPKGKPFCVIEGQVDINMSHSINSIDEKYKSIVCMFAGSLNRANGIDILIDAFSKADIADTELHIYGSGDYEQEIDNIIKKVKSIKFYGSVHNDIIIKEQLKASLLINPRPTDREFTKYSFPSKNMEYMVSGTPTLTTKLPGMPKDYYEYVYLIEDETVNGICKSLEEVLSKTKEELHMKGLKAKEFVLNEKNNLIQSKTILNMINKKPV